MTLKDRIKNRKVHFSHYCGGELWYQTEDGFDFPVPIAETGNATFLAEDKAIFFMRYIRQQMQMLGSWALARADALAPVLNDNSKPCLMSCVATIKGYLKNTLPEHNYNKFKDHLLHCEACRSNVAAAIFVDKAPDNLVIAPESKPEDPFLKIWAEKGGLE